MKSSFEKKSWAFAIIVLFFGMSVIPSMVAERPGLIETIYVDDGGADYTSIHGDDRYDFDIDECYYVNPLSDVEPMFWWDRWPDFPGRYEPFFDVQDIIEFGQTANGATSADFDNDDLLDFAISWSTVPWTQSTISVFYNDGEGGFTQDDVYTITEPELRYISDLDSGDYDNDGDIDFMFTYDEHNSNRQKLNGTVNLLFNDGTNNFNDSIMVAWHGPGVPGDIDNRINPQLNSADFDNDGDIDFLVGDNSGLVEFYKNDGTGDFSSAGIYDFGKRMSWGISSADFDNDGDIDFIVTQSKTTDSGYIYLKWNDGTPSCFNHSDFVQIAELHLNLNIFFAGMVMSWGCLQSIDYNDDGNMDFLFSGSDSVFLYMQKEIGIFDYFHIMRLPWTSKEDGGWGLDSLRKGGIAVGDFNGDHLDDMVTGSSNGFVRMCYNNLVLVDIINPDKAVFFVSNVIQYDFPFVYPLPIYSFLKHGTSIAIGDLTIEAKALEPLQKVEFYLDNKLVFTDDASPFEWNWDRFSFGRHKVKAVAYDLDGNEAGFDDTIIWKFL